MEEITNSRTEAGNIENEHKASHIAREYENAEGIKQKKKENPQCGCVCG